MCRLLSPLFGDPVFRRFSGDEFERLLRLSRAFHQERMGSGVIMSANAEAQPVRDRQDSTPDEVRLASRARATSASGSVRPNEE